MQKILAVLAVFSDFVFEINLLFNVLNFFSTENPISELLKKIFILKIVNGI